MSYYLTHTIKQKSLMNINSNYYVILNIVSFALLMSSAQWCVKSWLQVKTLEKITEIATLNKYSLNTKKKEGIDPTCFVSIHRHYKCRFLNRFYVSLFIM